jgi:hypothetical protein
LASGERQGSEALLKSVGSVLVLHGVDILENVSSLNSCFLCQIFDYMWHFQTEGDFRTAKPGFTTD